MVRFIRRAIPVALVFAIGLQGSAFATTKNVTAANIFFTPQVGRAFLGAVVVWTNTDSFQSHTTTSDTTNPLQWDSDDMLPGTSFTVYFGVAGSFTYHCQFFPTLMTGTIDVRPNAGPRSGVAGTTFTIIASTYRPFGMPVYDVQMKVPGGQFVDFVLGNTTGRVTFDSTGMASGVYQFRTRLRDAGTGNAAGYSPPASVTVT